MEIKVDFDGDILCSDCGNMLNFEWYGNKYAFYVEPCRDCEVETKDESYRNGHDEGYEEGYQDGKDEAELLTENTS
jgi:hypothetical protein